MKRYLKKLLAIFILLALVVSCVSKPGVQVHASGAKISENSRTIMQGASFRLYMMNTTNTPKWSSKNSKIAKVSSKGIVTALKTGKTTITAKVAGKSFQCKLTVIPSVKAEAVYGLNSILNYYSKDTQIDIKNFAEGKFAFTAHERQWYEFSYNYKFELELKMPTGEKKVMYFLVDSVNYSNREVDKELLAQQGFYEKIDKKWKKADVTKINSLMKLVAKGEYQLYANDGWIHISNDNVRLWSGNSYKLELCNAVKNVKWTSSNEKVATVDKDGNVSGISEGTATIKATSGGVTYKAKVQIFRKVPEVMRQAYGFLAFHRNYAFYPKDFRITDVRIGDFRPFWEGNSNCCLLIGVRGKLKDQSYVESDLAFHNMNNGELTCEVIERNNYSAGFTPVGAVEELSKDEIEYLNGLLQKGIRYIF